MALTEPARQRQASHGWLGLKPAPQRTRLPQGQVHHFDWILTYHLTLMAAVLPLHMSGEGALLGMGAGPAGFASAHPISAPPRPDSPVDFFLSVVLGDLVVGLGLDLPGLEDQGEPWAWELGHGHSGRQGWAGKPSSQAVYPVHCRPLAGTQGRDRSRAHILRCDVLALDAEDGGLG